MSRTRYAWVRAWATLALVLVAAACGGGGNGLGGPPSITAGVQVSWTANREAAVNRAGGGYRVYHGRTSGFDLATASFIDVPYNSGATAPTSTSLLLSSGDNFIKVVAYSALNPNGSAPSGEITVSVPFAAAP
ncbi:MAG TPA: hypothetical protein VI565_01445 [Burkholderiales bacterium]|nr:hypothetical protein [Burkholderiales bacterium]